MNKNIEQTINDIQNGKKKTIWFDIDGTLCDTNGTEYAFTTPDESVITLLNMLYDQGHNIFIFSARGGVSGKDWKALTKAHLKKWGVRYHKLIIGLPKDLIIDDAALRPDEFLNLI